MDINSYLEQHKEAAGLVVDLEKRLQNVEGEAVGIMTTLTTLIGKLGYHISMEDKYIYPKAVESTNDDLKAVATKMQSDMAPIGEALGKYAKVWYSADVIKKDPDTFVTETKGIIAALRNRIEVEEKDFYPLVKEHL